MILVDISLERAVISIDTAKLVELVYMGHDFIINLRSLRNKVVIEIKSID